MRVAELTPVYKKTNHPGFEISRLNSSEAIYEFASSILYNDPNGCNYDEKCFAVYLNNNFKFLAFSLISVGGLNETLVDIRKVMQGALLSSASLLVLVHNHPSGNVRNSIVDNHLTERVKKACDVMDIKMLDHVIVADGGFFSYRDEGLV